MVHGISSPSPPNKYQRGRGAPWFWFFAHIAPSPYPLWGAKNGKLGVFLPDSGAYFIRQNSGHICALFPILRIF
jgi:hypothetical protein